MTFVLVHRDRYSHLSWNNPFKIILTNPIGYTLNSWSTIFTFCLLCFRLFRDLSVLIPPRSGSDLPFYTEFTWPHRRRWVVLRETWTTGIVRQGYYNSVDPRFGLPRPSHTEKESFPLLTHSNSDHRRGLTFSSKPVTCRRVTVNKWGLEIVPSEVF